VAENPGGAPNFSPDGKYFWRRAAGRVLAEDRGEGQEPATGRGRAGPGRRGLETPAAPTRWEVVLTESGNVVRSLESLANDRQHKWAPSSDALTFIRTVDGVTNLWRLPLDGRPAEQVTRFAAGDFGGPYAWIADGSRLVFMRRAQPTTDVLLIKNFR
jgi:Tol biopolymer transport system component